MFTSKAMKRVGRSVSLVCSSIVFQESQVNTYSLFIVPEVPSLLKRWHQASRAMVMWNVVGHQHEGRISSDERGVVAMFSRVPLLHHQPNSLLRRICYVIFIWGTFFAKVQYLLFTPLNILLDSHYRILQKSSAPAFPRLHFESFCASCLKI